MLKQSHPLAAYREIVFHLTSSSTGAPLTGQTFATTDLQIRKPGAALYANCNAAQQTAVVEIGGGDYVYTCTAAELDTPGTGFSFKANKAGAQLWTMTDEIQRALFTTVQAGTLTAASFTSDRTETVDNFWQDVLVRAISGQLIGQVKKIGAYLGSTKMFTLATGLSFTQAPLAGDVFEIINA